MRFKPKHIVVLATLAIVVGFLIPLMFADQPGARSVQGNVITETIGAVETNAVATFQVRLIEGSDAQHESSHMFDAFKGMPGVGKASLDVTNLQLSVTYDDRTIAEPPIREALLGSGYLVPTAADAVPTELAEDRSLQCLAVDDTGDEFKPSLISAKAGIPIELKFAPGQDCRVLVKFPELGIEKDISKGATVSLPALKPGEYQIACSADGHEGTLLVE